MSSAVQVTILGCGTSTGVPMIGCTCRICQSSDPKNSRTRASVWVRVGGKSLLIDTSSDLRQQALKNGIARLDAILFTHPHADHVSGLDDVRAWNFVQKERIPAFGNEWTLRDLHTRFPYIFSPGPVEGGGIPLIDLKQIDGQAPEVEIVGVPVVPISLRHGSQETLGFRIRHFAYVTDCHEIPEASLERLKGLDVLVIDALRMNPHPTHLHLEKALTYIDRLKPKRAVLTHMNHEFDFAFWENRLPTGVALAYDGLTITCD